MGESPLGKKKENLTLREHLNEEMVNSLIAGISVEVAKLVVAKYKKQVKSKRKKLKKNPK